MAQHYKNPDITKSRVKVFLGWEHFNPKGNVAPGRMDQNLCGRLWTQRTHSSVKLSVASPQTSLRRPTRELLDALEYRPASIGDSFGPTFTTHVFRLDITIPQSMDGCPVHLLWDSNSEAMVLTSDAVPAQGLVGGDHWCRRADYPMFSDRPNEAARGGEVVRLYVEIACNGLFGAGRGGDIEPPDMARYYQLEECCIAVFDPVAWALIHDLTLLSGLAEHLPDCPRRAQALHVANEVVNAVRVDVPSTYSTGRAIASRFLSERNGDSQTVLHSALHSHIDLAWLWPMAVTPAKAARTFATQLRLMERYPDCVYVQSQAQLYEWVRDSYPSLWLQIRDRVREGRFVPVGATWVEMDCNIPSGESLVRQFVLGQNFFEEHFGIRCREFWLPDTFGYSSQLPQIMKGCGVDHFLTQKLSWNLFNKFPHSTFVWEGLDGSRVLAHMPPADTYNAQAFPEEVFRSANKNKDSSIINEAMMLVGHGDGGGGASPAMLESMKRMKNLDSVPRVEFSTPDRFFEEVRKKEHELPRWVGELYFELHRGTYTSQAKTKLSNRRCEVLLRDLESAATHALTLGAMEGRVYDYPASMLKKSWKLVLKNCFHDTLPGSCIGQVYEETARDYEFVMENVSREMERALCFIAAMLSARASSDVHNTKRLKVKNGERVAVSAANAINAGQGEANKASFMLFVRGTGHQAKEYSPLVVEVPCPSHQLPSKLLVQKVRFRTSPSVNAEDLWNSSEHSLVALRSRFGGLGFFLDPPLISNDDLGFVGSPVTISTIRNNQNKEYVLANSVVVARIKSSGILTSLLLRSVFGQDREALRQQSSERDNLAGGNRLVIFDDVPQFWCAWDTEVYSFEKHYDVSHAESCEIVEEGPLRVALHLKYPPTDCGSRIEQFISLQAESARLDFCTNVNWKENRKILRVLFHTDVRSSHANYDSQFGYVARPTTFNHSWEIAKFEAVGHQFCDISEHGFGVALLNDCKYGYSVRDSTMRLSLLRSSKSPDDNADIGSHRFTYAILPHWHSFPTREVIEEAAALNWAPVLIKVAPDQRVRYTGRTIRNQVPVFASAFALACDEKSGDLGSVVISAVKRAETKPDHIAVRLYESMGARGRARLCCPPGICRMTAQECNMLEDENEGASKLESRANDGSGFELVIPFAPFQIRTVIMKVHGSETTPRAECPVWESVLD